MEEHHAITQTRGWHRLARKRAGVVFNIFDQWVLTSGVPYGSTRPSILFSAGGAQERSLG